MGKTVRVCVIIPAFQAERHVGDVVRGAVRSLGDASAVFVVDDGSSDATADVARRAGATVVRHARNAGKGVALRTGLRAAHRTGFDVAVTVDADGQHPTEEIPRLAGASEDPEALVLGIRDLAAAGAPRANQRSNLLSNLFLSGFARAWLADTQCGLRRYPVATTLELGGVDPGYAFEAEILLRAIAAGLRVIEVPIRVVYPPEGERLTHFDSVKDPARIVRRVVATLVDTRMVTRPGSRVPLDRAAVHEVTVEEPSAPPAAASAREPAGSREARDPRASGALEEPHLGPRGPAEP